MAAAQIVAKWLSGKVAKSGLCHFATSPLRHSRGQSILEYLVIAAVIVAGVLAIRGTVASNVSTLFTNAGTKVSTAASSLEGLQIESPTGAPSASAASSTGTTPP